MSPQIACLNRCIVALVAFVWFFTRKSFQMCPQIARPNRWKVALIASVRFFSCVSFQMSRQSAHMFRCKVTYVALIFLFSLLHHCITVLDFGSRSGHHGEKLSTDFHILLVIRYDSNFYFQTLNFHPNDRCYSFGGNITMQLPSPTSRHWHVPLWWDEAAVGLSQEAGNGNGDDEVCGECFYSQTKTKVKQKKRTNFKDKNYEELSMVIVGTKLLISIIY